jgi:hypothetical protein
MSPDDQSKIAAFDKLSDDCILLDPIAAAILGISVWTLRRHNPVPPRQISERCRGRRVGDLRAFARREQPAALNEHGPAGTGPYRFHRAGW